MTTRPISQIIAELKATCAPESDVGLLCRFAEQVRADWKEIEREAESEDGADQQRYLRGLFGHMIRQRKACAKLHEQIKELKHFLQLANNNAAACMRVANERQEELKLAKEALRWAVTNGLLFECDEWFTDTGRESPEHLRATLESVIGESR